MDDEKQKEIDELKRKLNQAEALNNAFVDKAKHQKTGDLDKDTKNMIKTLAHK